MIELRLICNKCKVEQPTDSFSRNAKMKWRLQKICKSCAKVSHKMYYEANRARLLKAQNEYSNTNKVRIALTQKKRYDSDPDRFRAEKKQYRKDNSDAIKSRRKRPRDLALDAARSSNRRAFKKLGSNTCSDINLEEVKQYYLECKRLELLTGIKFEVDHVVPLVHPRVCGLHAPWNLQILTEKENRLKSNKFMI